MVLPHTSRRPPPVTLCSGGPPCGCSTSSPPPPGRTWALVLSRVLCLCLPTPHLLCQVLLLSYLKRGFKSLDVLSYQGRHPSPVGVDSGHDTRASPRSLGCASVRETPPAAATPGPSTGEPDATAPGGGCGLRWVGHPPLLPFGQKTKNKDNE